LQPRAKRTERSARAGDGRIRDLLGHFGLDLDAAASGKFWKTRLDRARAGPYSSFRSLMRGGAAW
jgi:hypothetical protein